MAAQVGVGVAVGVALGVSVTDSVGLGVGVGVEVSVTVKVGVDVASGVLVGVFGMHRDPPLHDALNTTVQPKQVPETGGAQNGLGDCAEPEH